MKKLYVLVIIVLFIVGCGNNTEKKNILEFRVAEEKAAQGLIEKELYGYDTIFYLHKEVLLTELDVENAELIERRDTPAISLAFTEEGKEKFSKATRENIGKRIGLLIDGVLYMAPIVEEEITTSKVHITGKMTKGKVKKLVRLLNKGK